MATKKKPAKKKAPAKKAPAKPAAASRPVKTNRLADVSAIVNGPNSAKGAIDELQNYLSGKTDKELEPIRALVQDGHTDGETVNNIRQYLAGKV
jgi:hypothetical protein